MKKARNLVVIFCLLLFVGSLASCSGSKGAKKTKRKRGCQCPKWGEVDKQQPQNQEDVVAFEESMTF